MSETAGGIEEGEAAPLIVVKQEADAYEKEEEEEVPNLFTAENGGLFAQYFAVGVLYGGLPATIYGLFLGYLNCPGYVYSTARVITMLPWSFKFGFGMINDCFPIAGYHRKSYMCIGWTLCALALLRLSNIQLPGAYWCDNGHKYDIGGQVCNPDAATQGGRYSLWLMCASCGYCIADVAADGLTVTLARKEAINQRGRLQTSVYLVRTMGQIVALLLVGLGLNSWRYNGSFQHGLSFPAICAIFSVPAAMMIPVSWFCVNEELSMQQYSLEAQEETSRKQHNLEKKKKNEYISKNEDASLLKKNVTSYRRQVFSLLRSRAFFMIVLFQFFSPLISGISTTAAGEVKQHWAKVQNLQHCLFSIAGLGLFAFGLYLVKSRFLSYSWRSMTLITTLILNFVDMPFTFLTIYDVVRNQYFYLGEVLIIEIPAAANFVVSTFVIVEMAQTGSEGLVYGLLTTTANLGSPVSQAISNQLFGAAFNGLSDAKKYVEDSASFRNTVAASFVLSYFFAFASLLTLPFLPHQKDHAARRLRHWPKHDFYAYVTIFLLASALIYSLTVNLLATMPATMCMRIAGGSGCDADHDT